MGSHEKITQRALRALALPGLLCIALLGAACAEESAGDYASGAVASTGACSPGATTACTCFDGAMGTQSCLDGSTLSECVCSGPPGCTPNSTQPCLCDGGDSGLQVCERSGRAWSTCVCMQGSMAGAYGGDDGSGGDDGMEPMIVQGPDCPDGTVCATLTGNPQPACVDGSLPPECPEPGEDAGDFPGSPGARDHGEGGCESLGFDVNFGHCLSYPDYGLGPMCWQACTLEEE